MKEKDDIMNFIKTFSEIRKNDVKISGGKGSSLGEMTNAKFPVPEGFVITTAAYDHFLKSTKIIDSIYKTLKDLDVKNTKTLENTSNVIQSLMLKQKIPSEIKEQIIKSYKTLGNGFVAVRSSANMEDLKDASFAGQQSTYLNVKGEEDVIKSIQRCWASLFTSRAIYYRQTKKFDHTKSSIAVVIQKMINAETSGIAFSVNPIDNNSNQIVIEAGFGLGESIVSGEVTPNNYIVSKDKLEIVNKKINEQKWGFYRDEKSGKTIKRNIQNSDKQTLTDKQIIQISKFVKELEDHYKTPQDIEWSIDKAGNFYILQSRPITTTSDSKRIEKKDPYVMMWAEENHNYFDAQPILINYGKRAIEKFGYGIKNALVVCKNFHAEFYLPESEIERLSEESYNLLMNKERLKKFLSEIENAENDVTERMKDLLSIDLTKLSNADLWDVYDFYGFKLSCLFSCYSLTQPERAKKLEEILTEFVISKTKDPVHVISVLTAPKTKFVFSKDANQLFKSFSESVEKENSIIDKSLFEKPMYIEEKVDQKEKIEILKSMNPPENIKHIIEILSTLGEERLKMRFVWMKALYYSELFLTEIRRRFKISKKDIRKLVFYEIENLVKCNKKPSKLTMNKRLKCFVAILKDGNISTLDGKEAIRLTSTLKENNKGILELNGTPACKGFVIGRAIIFSYKKSKEHASKIRKMKKGDIIITEMTRPNILIACEKAGAIVTDEGGMLSHAAIVSREFKIPCIVGTKKATSTFKDGDLLEVDANYGIIKKIRRG